MCPLRLPVICQAAFFPARTLAHRARCAAAIFLRAPTDSRRLGRLPAAIGVGSELPRTTLLKATIA